MEIEDKEPVSPTLQEEDEKFKLETEISDLRRMLNQQVAKYSHDMEVITQVRSRSAPGVRFTGMHLCLLLCQLPPSVPTPLSLLPLTTSCCVHSLFSPTICLCVSFVCSFLQQRSSASDPVTAAMREAAVEGNQSIVQLLGKQFVNVEYEVGRVSA